MAKAIKEIKAITMAGQQKGVISVARIQEPYGDNSAPVVSIAVSLQGETNQMEWKTHIPLENVDALIEALQVAKKG